MPRQGPGYVSENRLRDLVDGLSDPLTAEERAWCIREAVHFSEGGWRATDLEPLDDRTLAFEVLGAWWDYARDNLP